MVPLLELNDVVAGYGATQVLKGVSLTVKSGEALAVLGANGAGKSTLMKTIVGLVQPWSGSLRFDGIDITDWPAARCAAAGITLVPEGRAIFASLSIEENLIIGATRNRLRGPHRQSPAEIRRRLAEIYEMFPALGRRKHDGGADLSGGQQQMLAIGRGLMSDPRLLILDEPCLGLAPKVAAEVYEILIRVRSGGLSLIIVEESTRRALRFADRACVLKLGQKVEDRLAAEFTDEREVLDAYFGAQRRNET